MKPNDDEFLKRMSEAYELSKKDPEEAHINADEIMNLNDVIAKI